MRVAVLGAAGQMAQVVLRDLLEFHPDVEITAVDRRPPATGDPRVRWAAVDVTDESATARLLDGHDAALNCVTYYLNVAVMRAALAARVPYTDLGGLYHGSLQQFALDGAFREAGVPALLGMGSTPGITNAMAGALARRLDRVDEIDVRVAAIDGAADGPLPVPYALDTVLDEFCLPPMVFEGGRPRAVAPMSGLEDVDFPDPIGRVAAMSTLHSEVAMFPRSFPGLSGASFKVAFDPEFVRKMRFLVELGFASREKTVRDVTPREMLLALAARLRAPGGPPADCDALLVVVRGERAGEPVELRAECVVHPHPEWGLPAGAIDTGCPLAIAGAMLAGGEIAGAGVLCPELALPFERFFAELRRRAIEVRFEEETA
jgi:lysine 6-dehydrogenase